MKVKFYPDEICSDIIEVPDDISEDELYDMACNWVADNVSGFFIKVNKYGREIFEDDEFLEDE